jgi:hypothetical protein
MSPRLGRRKGEAVRRKRTKTRRRRTAAKM